MNLIQLFGIGRSFGHQPAYSDLIDRIEISRAARTNLLRSYFEPSEVDREEGNRIPTRGHRAIAQLVQDEYVRVILTTNFDRLMEQALGEIGVNPVVITSDDSASGMMPLVHSRAVLVKINGDYLDPNFRNTEAELGRYEPALESLLDRTLV